MFFDLTGLYWERMFLFVRCNSPKLIKIDVLSQNVISNFKDDHGKTLFSNKIIKIARYVEVIIYHDVAKSKQFDIRYQTFFIFKPSISNTYQLLVNIDL